MLIIISPAKTMDMQVIDHNTNYATCKFLSKSKELVSIIRNYSHEELEKMMGISEKLALLNFNRFQNWEMPITLNNGKQALFAFKGEVYTGIDAGSLSETAVVYAQKHLRILSGLYAVLKPLDLIAAYRLEMGIPLQNKKGHNLYRFWGNTITKEIQSSLQEQGDDIIINLASNEYFKSIDTKKLQATIISPEFRDFKNGKYKIISFFAKKARGKMTRFILDNKIEDPENLKLFDSDGYFYNHELSKPNKPVFSRG